MNTYRNQAQQKRSPTGGHGQKGRGRDNPGQSSPSPSRMSELCGDIVLNPKPEGEVNPALFDDIAHKAAKIIGEGQGNKPTQLRKFYDEIVMWEEKVNGEGSEEQSKRLRKYLPMIRMLNAKAAYAKGRKLVNDDFVVLLRRCLEQLEDDPETLRHVRLFFEAFMGFYKSVNPSG